MSDTQEMITVTILPANAPAKQVEIAKGSTVQQALEAAEISLDKAEGVRVSGQAGSLNQVLDSSVLVSIAPNIAGA